MKRLTVAVVLLVLLRSAIWVFWEQAHFDSDQAVWGLMAKHLAEGRALPIVMYGQNYLLGVEAWLAAPLVALVGTKVWALKLPLLTMNVAVALLLLRLLRTEARLSAPAAFAASLWFLMPPPITASRLVEVSGGSIEPLLYTLLLWIARHSPVAWGLVAGFGIAHREFTAYAVVALIVIELVGGELKPGRLLRTRLLSVAIMAAVLAGVRALARFGSVMGPGTAGVGLRPSINPSGVPPLVDPVMLPAHVNWLFSQNLATLFGWRTDTLADFGAASSLTVGHWWMGAAVGVLVAMAAWATWIGIRQTLRSRRESPLPRFAFYLIVVGVEAAVAYMVTRSAQDRALIRYTLLVLFALVGATALALQRVAPVALRRAAIVSIAIWAAGAALDTVRVWNEYGRHRPVNRARRLIAYLDQQQVRFGRAPYWTAYLVDFVSSERIILASSGLVRVQMYQQAVESTGEPRAMVTDGPCRDGSGTFIQFWCVRIVGTRPAGDGANVRQPPRAP